MRLPGGGGREAQAGQKDEQGGAERDPEHAVPSGRAGRAVVALTSSSRVLGGTATLRIVPSSTTRNVPPAGGSSAFPGSAGAGAG
ncbi:hypothetical protein [Streptomyces griseoviridis]|uniref:Uncharacterized protein n=1 Tax=Streptomyces griseoviridis TaxID=45398 RepID=A0A918LHV8_STRGD|nr:hypothetical protein [Streptomyces niveoruber]GGS50091.1 hypothetical protein GCM10010238_44510 [Streptomyces niveoruber]